MRVRTGITRRCNVRRPRGGGIVISSSCTTAAKSASAIASTRTSSGNHGIASSPSNVPPADTPQAAALTLRAQLLSAYTPVSRAPPHIWVPRLLGMTHAHQGEPPWHLKTPFAPRKSTAGGVCDVREQMASEREEACVSLPSRPPSRA
ncbi:hypothetical protein K438DRAFT_1999289 [Mycena galopus ATCC 62051]|nr:hypothetical protein K438DRAFT_1999289 [Mycena galopus ATCC 62051]